MVKKDNIEELQKQLQDLKIRVNDIENKIKKIRTLSAYQLYSKDIREKVTKEIKDDESNKDLNGKEINNKIMKKIGESWTNISTKDKHKYEEKAKKLKI